MKLHFVSLGCVRNLVDSEVMLGRLKKAGWIITQDPAEANTIVINTCSFIEAAVNESIDTILELAQYKKRGSCKHLIVVGCLPERFREEIIPALPEVDAFLGTGAFDRIIEAANGLVGFSECLLPNPYLAAIQNYDTPRFRLTPFIAYLKVAEGCNRKCTYCIIPKLRGRQKSRPIEDIMAEARELLSSDVKELILVAQDTSSYGKDLCPPIDLSFLLKKISALSNRAWLRILYGHPQNTDDKLIETVAGFPNICPYYDIPIQHASEPVLQKMGRHYTRQSLYRLFDKIRKRSPDAALRTTVMVGFPGETDKDFETLLAFVNDICFDLLGVFIYSDFEDLPSHRLRDHVPKQLANERYDRLMSRQKEISLKKNQNRIGKVFKVLVEDSPEENLFTGRTYFQAPEVDGIVFIHSKNLHPGAFASVRITDALEYDLIGEAA